MVPERRPLTETTGTGAERGRDSISGEFNYAAKNSFGGNLSSIYHEPFTVLDHVTLDCFQ